MSVALISAEEERKLKEARSLQDKELTAQAMYAILAQGSADAASAASKRIAKLESELGRMFSQLSTYLSIS